MDKWKRIQEDFEAEDVYIASGCALYYDLDFDNYVKGQKSSNHISIMFIFNSSGSDKKELSVFGKETLEAVTSLPLKYHICEDAKVTFKAIQSYLLDWNESLKSEERNIRLLIYLPTVFKQTLQRIGLCNIDIVDLSDLNFISTQVQKIVKCFKYHYRKLQILKNIVHSKGVTVIAFLDYINMMTAAWHNVSNNYIHHLFYPYEEGSPNIDEEERRLSLLNWCMKYNVPINIDLGCETIDDFILCDNQLQSTNFMEFDDSQSIEVSFDVVNSTSGIEAYQAMKRLLSYLQGEGVHQSTIKSAKSLEDHLQIGALQEMQGLFAKTASDDD